MVWNTKIEIPFTDETIQFALGEVIAFTLIMLPVNDKKLHSTLYDMRPNIITHRLYAGCVGRKS